MAATWLQDRAPLQLLGDELQLAFLNKNKRIHYADSNGNIQKKTTFASVYYSWNFFPKPITDLS